MRWQEVESLEMLKQLGKLKEVVEVIQCERVGEKIPSRSWKALYDYVVKCQAELELEVKEEGENQNPDTEIDKLNEDNDGKQNVNGKNDDDNQHIKDDKGVQEEQVENIFNTIQSLEELKALGSFNEVRKKVFSYIGDEVKGIRGWAKLFEHLVEKRGVVADKPNAEDIPTDTAGEKELYTSPYFQDEVSEIIFYLLELDGDVRMKKLGLNKLYYRDKSLASTWKNKIMKMIHPDQTSHDKAEEATKELNELYRSMIQFAK